MNHTGTVCQRYISIACNIVCFLFQFYEWEERLILFVLQFFSCIALQDLIISFSQNLIKQGFCHIVGVFPGCHFYIGFIWVHTQCHIGRKGPGCCGPCQNICVLAFYFKTGDSGAFFYVLVSLGYLMAGKRGSAARAVGNDFISFIQKAFVPDLF